MISSNRHYGWSHPSSNSCLHKAGLVFSVTKYFHYSPYDYMTYDVLWCPLKNTLMYTTFFHSVVGFGLKISVLGICQTH